jgi:hypothetical protein
MVAFLRPASAIVSEMLTAPGVTDIGALDSDDGMTSISMETARPVGWLRGARFDTGFILGTTAIAVLSGGLVVMEPKLFAPILMMDLWLLGYHHVIATYTRLCFDGASARQHRFLLLWLPFLVLGAALGLAMGLGLWVLGSVYLYWQWFHYTRQSWGVSQVYRRKAGGLLLENEGLTKIAFYLLPLWGILYRSWQAPESFLGLEIRVIPVPGWLVDAVAAAAIASLVLWVAIRVRTFLRGEGPVAHTLYMASHFTVFAVGYLLIEDVTYGWLVINVWHNAQYILFVWLFNTNRYRDGIDANAVLLSTISQPANWWRYGVVCLAISTLVYGGSTYLAPYFLSIGLPSMIVLYQAINFHHYIVDSLIWKVRKAPMQKTLGLSSD